MHRMYAEVRVLMMNSYVIELSISQASTASTTPIDLR